MKNITTSLISVKRINLTEEQQREYCMPDEALDKIVNSLLELGESAIHLYVIETGKDENGFSLYELAYEKPEQIFLLQALKIASERNLKDFETVPCIRVIFRNIELEQIDIMREVEEQLELIASIK